MEKAHSLPLVMSVQTRVYNMELRGKWCVLITLLLLVLRSSVARQHSERFKPPYSRQLRCAHVYILSPFVRFCTDGRHLLRRYRLQPWVDAWRGEGPASLTAFVRSPDTRKAGDDEGIDGPRVGSMRSHAKLVEHGL